MNKNIFWFFLFLINIPYLLIHGTDRCRLQEFDRSIKAYATQPSSDPEVVKTLHITHALINKTQEFFNQPQDLFNDEFLESCADNVSTIIDHLSTSPFKKKSLLNVIQSTLNNICPVYTYFAIGSLSDLEGTSQRSSLIAVAKPLEADPSIDFNEALAVLIGIAQEFRFKSHNLDELMQFYCLTGLCDSGDANLQNIKNGRQSLLEHLQSKNIASADSADDSGDSFFSTAKALISFDQESKIRLIQSILGEPYDSSQHYSILGNINEIATLPVSTPNQASLSFQRMLIGQNEFKQSYADHTRSLFSSAFEIRSLTDTLLQNMDAAKMHQLIRHIGLWGDETPQSLFGALAILKRRFSAPKTDSSSDSEADRFKNFDEAFGLSEQLTSCCGHLMSLKKEMILPLHAPTDTDTENCLFYLSPESIIKLASLPSDTDKRTVKRLILDDFIEHINGKKNQPLHEGSLIFQLNNLYQSTASFSQKSHIANRIGTQLENGGFTSFSFRLQLDRFIQDLLSSDDQSDAYPFALMEDLEYSYLYRVFFGSINSIQARLYEIAARQITDNRNYADIIGSILSQDQSMFGLINHVIKNFEIEPILSQLGSVSVNPGEDEPLNENGSIVDRLRCIIYNINNIKIVGDENDEINKKINEAIEQLRISIGIAYTPYSLSNSSLINLMIYFKDIFNQSFSIIPREKIFKYAGYIYESNKPDESDKSNKPDEENSEEKSEKKLGSISELVQDALENSKNNPVETFGICGIINDQQGTSIWVQTNAILNGLYEDILGLIQSNDQKDADVSQKEDVNVVQEEDLSLSGLLSKLHASDPENTIDFVETKITKLNSFIKLFQTQHFHLSLNALVQHIFGILPQYTEMINFDVLNTYDIADHSLEPIGLLEAITNASSDNKLIRYGSINDEITEKTLCGYLNNMLYIMISKPLLDLLYRDPNTPDALADNNIFSLLQTLKANTNAHPDLFDDEVNESKGINPVGSEKDELTEENIDSVTIFALFNEIFRILSQTHLFMNEIESYTNIKNVLQDCYDTEKDATRRSLFSNLKYIMEKFDETQYLKHKENIVDAIGNKNDNIHSTRKTIYQSLNSIIYHIISEYKYFIFNDNFPRGGIHFDSNLSIMDHLNTMNHILDDPYYSISIQNKDDVLGYFRSTHADQKDLFQQIKDKLQTFDHPKYPEFKIFLCKSRPLHSFLLFSKLLQNSTQQFVQSKKYSTLLEKLDCWSYYIENIISFGPCDGCHRLNNFINQIIYNLDEIIENLKQLSPNLLNSILLKNSLVDLNCLTGINKNIQNLTSDIKDNHALKELKTFECYFAQNPEMNPCFQTLEGDLYELHRAIQKIWENVDLKYVTKTAELNLGNPTSKPAQNSDCILLQYNINQLGNKLNDLSVSLPIPNADDISYNQENLIQLELVEKFINDLIGTETDNSNNAENSTSIIRFFRDYSTCAGCLVEQLDVQLLLDSLKNVVRRIGLIKAYIKNSMYTTFIKNIYQISLTTNHIAQCFNYNISSSHLIETLNKGNLGATLQDLVTAFQRLPFGVENIYQQYEKTEILSDDLYQALEDCNANLKQIYQKYLAINRCFYPQNYLIEPASKTSKYTFDKLPVFLQSILSDTAQINKTWKSFNTAASSLTSIQEDRFLIPALSELRSLNSDIVKHLDLNLALWISKDPLNDLEVVFLPFLKELSSLLNNESTFLTHLKTTFSNLCITPCVKAMNQFTQTLFLFSEYLKLIPNTHLKDNDDFVSVLLPNFSNVLQSITQILTLPSDFSKAFCLHFFITQTFINLTNVMNNAVHSIRKLPSVSSHDSISIAVEDSSNINIWGNDIHTQLICIANQLEKINQWFEFAARNCQPVQLCNSILFNHLNNLVNTYDQLINQANQLKASIIDKPLCIYTLSSPSISDQQWMNISRSFDFQKQAVLKMIDNLQAKLYCSEKIERILLSLSHTIYDIAETIQKNFSNKNIVLLLQEEYSKKILPYIQNIFVSVDSINSEIYHGITFFEQHQNQIFCISETTEMVNNVCVKTNYLKNELNNLFKNVESNSIESSEAEQDIITNIRHINLKLAHVASQNFDIPSDICDPSISYSIQNIAQKIQKTSEYLRLLSKNIEVVLEHQNEKKLFKCHVDLKSINDLMQQMHQLTKEIATNLLTIHQRIHWQIKLNINTQRLENLQNDCDASNNEIFNRTKEELAEINQHINATSTVIFKALPGNPCISSISFNFEP